MQSYNPVYEFNGLPKEERSVAMQCPKVRFLFLMLVAIVCSGGGALAQMVPNPDFVRGPALRYNMPVSVVAQSFSDKRLWAYARYDAQQLDSTGTMQTVASAQPPYDLSGILAGGANDPRSYSGADMVILRKVGDVTNIGPVRYGDTVEVVSTCIAGDRTGQEVVYPEGRVLISLPTCRNDWASKGMFGLAFVRYEHPDAQGLNRIFVLQNTSNPSDSGVVYQNDLVYVVSNGDDLHNGKRIWQSVGSEYGTTWNEWYLGDSTTTNRDVAQGKLFIKHYVINATNGINAGKSLEALIPDSVVSQVLVDGTPITLKFAKTGKFMRVEAGGAVTANGTSASDPACQFTVTRVGKWIGLKNNATGNYLEAVSVADTQRAAGVAPYTVRAVASVCNDTTPWALWAAFPTTKSLKQVALMSRSTLGCLNIPAADGKILTSAGRNVPADISSSSLVDVDIVSQNAPSGFTLEAGLVFAFSVGSRNGQIEVWGIDPTAKMLQRYNPYNMSPNPWDNYSAMMMQGGLQMQIQPIYSVTCASDGTLAIADGKGVVYLYDWNNQIFIPLNMKTATGSDIRADKVVAGNANSIWAVNQLSKILYQFNMTTNVWEPRTAAGVAVDMGVGVDGTVVSVNVAGDVYRYLDQNRWQLMSGSKLDTVTVGSASYIWGVYQGQLWNFVNNKFVPVLGDDGKPAVGFQTAAINAAGSCWLIDQDGDVWYKGTAGVVIPKPEALPVVNTSTQVAPVVAIQVQQPTEETRADAQAAGKIEAVVKVAPAAAVAATTATSSDIGIAAVTATTTSGVIPSVATTTPATTTTAAPTSTAVTSTVDAKAQLQQAKAASLATKTATETAVKQGRVADRPKGQTVTKTKTTGKTAAVATTISAGTTTTPVTTAVTTPAATTTTAAPTTAKSAATTTATKPAATTTATAVKTTVVTPVSTTKKAAVATTKATTATVSTAPTATDKKSAKAAGK